MSHVKGKKRSIYDALNHDRYEIRMLTIQPGTDGDEIKCSLETTYLINPAKYAALSYCWGNPKITTRIFVNDVEFQVTVNLEHALRQLRSIGVTRVWADALCINQSDNSEKGHQIRLMKQIYSRAEETYAWMGEDETGAVGDAIFFLQTILLERTKLDDTPHSHPPRASDQGAPLQVARTKQRREKPNGCQRCLFEKDFRSLLALFEIEYWKRRWIIQEIAAASRVVITCKGDRITLEYMISALEKCRTSSYWDQAVQDKYYYLEKVLTFREYYQADNRPRLCDAIKLSQRSRSSDVRDKVLALLGISKDGLDLVPEELAYQYPVEVLIAHINKEIMRKTSSLDLILLNSSGGYEKEHSMPGWSPNWLSPNLPSYAYSLAGRKAGRRQVVLFDDLPIDSGILRVRGVVVSKIAQITSPVEQDLEVPSRDDAGFQLGSNADSSVSSYYTGYRNEHRALFECLTSTPVPSKDVTSENTLLALSTALGRAGRASRQNLDYDQRIINAWIEKYANFPIRNTTLKDCLRVDYFTRLCVRIYRSWFLTMLCILIYYTIDGLLLFYISAAASQTSSKAGRSPDVSGLHKLAIIIFAIMTMGTFIILAIYSSYAEEMNWVQDSLPRFRKQIKEFIDLKQRLLVSKSGFLGRTNAAEARSGDLICFLDGCSSAVILRKVQEVLEDENEDRPKRYKIIGSARLQLSVKDWKKYRKYCNSQVYQDDDYPREVEDGERVFDLV